MKIGLLAIAAILLGACASSRVMPLGDNTFQISSSAAPVCGQAGAERVAFQRAAVETVNRGFDSFRILAGNYSNDVRVVGYTPVTARTTHSGSIYASGYGRATYGGTSNTYVSGGQPIVGGSHGQGLVVRMYREGEPGATGAISARGELGPDWQKIVKSNRLTCT